MLNMLRILVLAFIINACSNDNQQILSLQEKVSITDTVKQTLNNYYADIKKLGLTAEFRYLDSSSDFFWVPPGFEKALNYDSVHAILIKNAPSLRSIDNSWETLSIYPLSKDLANYTGKIRSVVKDTAGNVFHSMLIETGLLIKRKDGWKLLSGQTAIVK
jgi:hypothetical protein